MSQEQKFEKVDKVFEIPMELVEPNEWNPNEQTEEVFNTIVDNIEEAGMVQPILVAPKEEEEGKFRIVDGEHRYEACRVLGYDTIPAYIEEFDEDMQKFQTIRMNVIKGKLSPKKFTDLFNEMAEKYGEEMTKQMMMFVDEEAFESVYQGVKKELPDDMQEELESTKEEIETIDDLSQILNQMFSKYGDTLDQNFMIFKYGTKTHLWVQMSKQLKESMIDDAVEELKEKEYDINKFFECLLEYREEALEMMEGENGGTFNEDTD